LASAGAHVSIAGRSNGKEVLELMRLASAANRGSSVESEVQQFTAYSVDLSSVEGCIELVRQVKNSSRGVDLLVFTLGVWPDPINPRTPAGVHKTIAIDVIARFTIFHELHLNSLLSSRPVVMSVLASTKQIPPLPIPDIKQIVTGVRDPTMLEFFVVGPILDAILAHAGTRSEFQHVQFVGTYPGFVSTELMVSSNTAPKWLVKIGFLLLSGLNLVLTEEDTGLRHTSLLNAAVNGSIKKQVAYFDHELVGRHGDELTSNVEFQEWLWSYLCSLSLHKSN
jgi:hypothetical protein